MTNYLLVSSAWILDVIFFVLLIGGGALGVRRGFINSIVNLAKTYVALIVAVIFCVSFSELLESWFGMTSAIANGLSSAFEGLDNFTVQIGAGVTGENLGMALEKLQINAFARWILTFAFSDVAMIPATSTPALMMGTIIAKWISIIIAFVLLVFLVKFGAKLVGKLLTSLINSIKPAKIVNQVLGCIFTVVEAFVLIFVILSICSWLPIDGLHEYISSSYVVGWIYNSTWFAQATNYAISGAWFSEYLAGYLIN